MFLPKLRFNSRNVIILLYHIFAVLAANYLAFYLRFDGKIHREYIEIMPVSMLVVLIIRLPLFSLFGLYKGLWRYAGMVDLQKILACITLGSVLRIGSAYMLFGQNYPRSVLVLDWLLLVGMIGGVRFAMRSWVDYKNPKAGSVKRVLIIGAGSAGELIVRDMLSSPHYRYVPVGFIDDDENKTGLEIHGVPILGTRKDLAKIIKKHEPQEILLAIPSAKSKMMEDVISGLSDYRLPIKTLPNLKEIMEGRVTVNSIRKLELEDLLTRPPVKADAERLVRFISGKSVMVTGAGGSIGSEICRQVADYGAKAIIAYERHENSAYTLEMDFRRTRPYAPLFPFVGDINDKQRLEEALEMFRPDIIFHAAAHKHVPMMERNPREAIKNNIMGTRRVALLAGEYGVDTFVLISTDKAVNPTNVMGASKRACELMVKALNGGSSTKYITVRFGNVLGSSGSVVPLFREQINRGGPVTVTHPEITRFLMLIPEAVLLVMHAASIGSGGEVYVLDMGEPISIAQLARDLIVLSGYEPDKDIKIEYVGLRPGEKLYEELFDECERVEPTAAEKINMAVYDGFMSREAALRFGTEMEALLVAKDTAGMMRLLTDVVKTYRPGPAGPVGETYCQLGGRTRA